MELGNLVFGNSRGQVLIERGAGYEDELSRLFDAYAPSRDHSWRDYGEEFENDVFAVFPYYWGDCDCGYEERWEPKDEEWQKQHSHAATCYQTELKQRKAAWKSSVGYDSVEQLAFGKEGIHNVWRGFNTTADQVGRVTVVQGNARKDAAMEAWRAMYSRRQEFERQLYAEMCEKYGLSELGCACHCTCDYESLRRDWLATDSHAPTCSLVRPNFLFKPTGFQIQWYKYPLRDAYMTPRVSLDEFRSIINQCVTSLREKC